MDEGCQFLKSRNQKMVKKIIKEINLPACALSYFALFSLAIIENSKSPIYPNLLKEFSLTHQQGSWVFTLASILGIVATATSKFWLSKYGVFKAKKYWPVFSLWEHFYLLWH